MERFRVQCTRFWVENQGGISNNLHFWGKYSVMAKVLISLVSQQRIPNVLAIMDPYFGDVDEYLFISSDRMQKADVVKHIIEATGIDQSRSQTLIVKPHDWQNIRVCLDKANLSNDDRYFINLTGGTKIMPLAVFSFFSDKAWNVNYFYFPIAKNVIQQVSQKRPNVETPISYKVSIRTYLTSYGINLEKGDFESGSKPIAVSRQLLDFYLLQKTSPHTKTNFWSIAGGLRKFRYRTEPITICSIDGLDLLIQKIKMPLVDNDHISPSEIQYLTGGWFEEWIYQETKEILNLSNEAIGRNLVINWLGKDAQHGRNELDIVFIYDNMIHIVECKTGLGGRSQDVSEQFTRTLNQLAVFSKEMGQRLKMIFLTLSLKLRQPNGDLKAFYKARANLLDITIIDRDEIIISYRNYLLRLKES